jgi:molecular chaperone DnaK
MKEFEQIRNLKTAPSGAHGHEHDDLHDSIGTGVILGIDLGTTNSLVAVVENGVPRILPTEEGNNLLPSSLSFEAGETLYGFSAKKNRLLHPEVTISSVKRFLGKKFSDLGAEVDDLPFKVSPGNDDSILIDLGDRKINAIEASSMVLASLKRSAEKTLGHPVKEAVITVPAYFNDSQRQATRLAGRCAGLDVLRIVNEPTAAALAYGLLSKKNGLIAVYDLGGGTFDLSILKLENGIFEVLSTSGNTHLGGDDIDRALMGRYRTEIESTLSATLDEHLLLKAQVLEEAERVKKSFSDRSSVLFQVSFSGKSWSKEITSPEFSALVRPLLEQTRQSCEAALKDAGLKKEDLTNVILVGGPTRLPQVRDYVAEVFGQTPDQSMHPDEVVALGAAIQADILAGNNAEFLLLDVVPLSLGIETYGNLLSVLIPRNTKVPAQARETFTTYVDRQTGVDIHVLQGEREKADENRSLAKFKLSGLEPVPAGFPRIEVRFLIDADGILQVTAKDLRTGKEQLVEVKPTYGLGDAEISRMVESAADHALVDYEHRKWVEVRNGAEPVLRATEERLNDARRLLPMEEVVKIETLCKSMRDSFESKDSEKAQNLKYELNSATVRLAELVVREALSKNK